MPAPGDQHNIVVNPFEEARTRVSDYTAQEIATLQSRLEKQLGPEYLSSRAGPSGQKVHYIAADKCIALANEVFGFNGWSSSIQNIQVDFVDEHPQTLKISLGLSVVVRVTLRDGTFHEDIGYGHIENCKGKAAAFEKAKKEGTTDGLKRALRNFGNVLGNCIYDKAYLAKVTKLKVEPTKFDIDGLHRHSDFAIKREPIQKEATSVKVETGALVNVPPPRVPSLQSEESFEDFLGDIDEADFNITEEGHPDEVVLPPTSNHTNSTDRPQAPPQNNVAPMHPPSRPLVRSGSAGSNYSRPPHTPNHQPPSRPNGAQNSFNNGAQNHVANGNGPRGPPQQQFSNQNRPATHQSSGMNQNPQAQMTPPQPKYQPPPAQNGAAAAAPPPGDAAVGFFSARAVKDIPEDSLNSGQAALAPKAGQIFNPRAESPSIRKTPGIDHTKSKPLARNGQHVPSIVADADAPVINAGAGAGAGPAAVPRAITGGPPMARGNHFNPQFDQARRIGAPGASSPLANRGQYRPPTMKRPAAADNPGLPAAGRAPLAEVSSNAPAATTATTAAGAGAGAAAGQNGGQDFKRQRVG
ncbi:recombination protein rad52 [Podospora appendiculata]|uniref:RAD52 homolog n=1 Tax=Podospora appendiculata TaxID=314037 RepID=A0AAE0X6A0_9PEZI|nr:recombination protein rad52 [Podospora appendiculata]